MKKIYVLLLSAFSFIMLSGCNDWIELEPKDTVANENFFKTKDDFDQAVTGLYSMLRPLDDEAKDGAYLGICIGKFVQTYACIRIVGRSPGLIYHGVN